MIKLSERKPPVKRRARRRANDPLQSPLVAHTRKLVTAALEKATEQHLSTHSTEEALASGGYIQGMADCMMLLEFVAVELARKVSA